MFSMKFSEEPYNLQKYKCAFINRGLNDPETFIDEAGAIRVSGRIKRPNIYHGDKTFLSFCFVIKLLNIQENIDYVV